MFHTYILTWIFIKHFVFLDKTGLFLKIKALFCQHFSWLNKDVFFPLISCFQSRRD